MRTAPPEPIPNPSALALRLMEILTPLRALIAAGLLRTRFAPIIVPLWNHLKRIEHRFTRLATLFAAGHLPAPRIGRAHGRPTSHQFPTDTPWLIEILKHHAAYFRTRLERFLAEPETVAFLAASPTAAGLFTPVCRILAITPPSRPRRRKPAPAPSRPATPPPAPQPVLAATRAEPPPEPSRFSPRQPPELCPRLLTRWPFAQRPSAKPA